MLAVPVYQGPQYVDIQRPELVSPVVQSTNEDDHQLLFHIADCYILLLTRHTTTRPLHWSRQICNLPKNIASTIQHQSRVLNV